MTKSRMIETAAAVLERTDEQVVEVRFKPDVKLDASVLGEVVHAKHELCATTAADILIVLPVEFDFDLNIMSVDHRLVNGGCGLSRRLALAAASPFNERIASIYFRYHPREGDTAVFLEESDARAWLTRGIPKPSLS